MAVGVGVVSGRNVEAVAVGNQRSHRKWARAVHANLGIPVEGHEAELKVDVRVDHGEVQAVALADLSPIMHGCSAHRIGPDAHTRTGDGLEVEHAAELRNVVVAEVERLRRWLGALYLAKAGCDEFVGSRGDHVGCVRVGRATVRRVVFDATFGRRVVARGDHDAVGAGRIAGCEVGVVIDDRNRDGRGRCVSAL